jgi:phytoene dehydrogenase-like protein
MAEERFDVIVVGAGFGGSACAGLLAKRGLKVLLLEKNAKAGGKAMAFSKSGFVYTPWVVITAPIQDNAFERVLKELGMEDRVELVTPDASGGAIFKNAQGKYVPMPPVPTDSTPDPNTLFDWLEVPEEQRGAAVAAMAEITLMPPDQIDEHDDISFAEFLTRYDLPAPVYGSGGRGCGLGSDPRSADDLPSQRRPVREGRHRPRGRDLCCSRRGEWREVHHEGQGPEDPGG